MRRRQFIWENYASVEMLAQYFSLSKRRIQQLLQQMIADGKVEVVVAVIDPATNAPYARPLYRIVR